MLATIFDRITDAVGGGPGTYGIVFAAAALDAFFPLVPSETVVITAGTISAEGKLFVVFVIAAAAVGAFGGDNVSFWLGRLIGEPVSRRLFRGEKGRRRLRWAERMLQRHGAVIIVAARYVPGGRTATTFAAGTLGLAWRRFAAYDAIAVLSWATYAAMIGFVGGRAFAESPWKALALAFGLAAVLAGAIEGWRRYQASRGRDILGARGR